MTDGSDGDDGRPDDAADSASDGQESTPDPGEPDETDSGGGGFSRVPDDDERAPNTDGDFRIVDGEKRIDDSPGDADDASTGTGDTSAPDVGDGAADSGSESADSDSESAGSEPDEADSGGGGFSRVPDDDERAPDTDGDFRIVDGEKRIDNGGNGDSPPSGGESLDDRGPPREYDRPTRDAEPDRDVAGVADDRLPDGVDDRREEAADTGAERGDAGGEERDNTGAEGEDGSEADEEDTPTSYVVGDNTAELDGEEHDPEATPDAPLASEALVDRPPQQVNGETAPPGASPAGAGGSASAGVGTGTGTGTTVEDDEGGLLGEAPDSDEEMPLTEHIEEMMRRLGAVFAVGGAVTFGLLLAGNYLASVPNTETLITFLWDAHVGFDNYRPYVYGPLELLLTKLKVAGLAGVIAALPVFVYQTYRFMRPGLYPNERRYYLAAVPTSLVLALVGVAFAHFIVLPAIFQYFIGYTEASAQLAFGLKETFNLILLLMGYMAVVFQIPLFIQLATMMGVVSREWLEQRRLLFWGSFLGLSFLVSPDPTGMSPIIVAVTMVVLFEGTLALLRWTGS